MISSETLVRLKWMYLSSEVEDAAESVAEETLEEGAGV